MGWIIQRRPFVYARRARSLFDSAWTHLSDHQVLFLPSKRKCISWEIWRQCNYKYWSITQFHMNTFSRQGESWTFGYLATLRPVFTSTFCFAFVFADIYGRCVAFQIPLVSKFLLVADIFLWILLGVWPVACAEFITWGWEWWRQMNTWSAKQTKAQSSDFNTCSVNIMD